MDNEQLFGKKEHWTREQLLNRLWGCHFSKHGMEVKKLGNCSSEL
jgi:hypothetical protein